jgi:hypothetical protein
LVKVLLAEEDASLRRPSFKALTGESVESDGAPITLHYSNIPVF